MDKIIGLDVSKTSLDICIYVSNEKPVHHRFANTAIGQNQLIELLARDAVKLVICEPTGGYESAICQQLFEKGYAIHKVNTYIFSSFCKSVNLCKTDQQNAFKLAYYGDKMERSGNYNYEVTCERLKRYQQRREDLVLMLSNEKRRLERTIDCIERSSVERVISYLQEEITYLDKQLAEHINQSDDLQEKLELLKTVPGIGTCLASKIISFMPELGDKQYSFNQLSALVGVAHYARESGNKRGRRFTRGGRKIPRDALYRLY